MRFRNIHDYYEHVATLISQSGLIQYVNVKVRGTNATRGIIQSYPVLNFRGGAILRLP